MRHGPPWRGVARRGSGGRTSGSVAGSSDELAVDDVERDARAARGPSSPGRAALAERHAGELAGLGLAVAVADPEAGRLVPGAQHLGVERLAGGDEAAQRRERAQRARAWRSRGTRSGPCRARSTRLALEQLEPLVRVEARVVQQRRGAAQPRRDEDVARGLRPARGGGAPRRASPARGVEPVLGLHALAGAGSAGRAAPPSARPTVPDVNVTRHGSSGASSAGGDGLGRGQLARRGRRARRPSGAASPSTARLRSSHTISRGCGDASRSAQVAPARSCSVQGSTTAPMAEAGDHRQHPLGPVADQRQHDVAAPDARGPRARRRRAPRPRATSPKRPLAPRAVAPERDQRPPLGRGGVDDVAARSSSGVERRQVCF